MPTFPPNLFSPTQQEILEALSTEQWFWIHGYATARLGASVPESAVAEPGFSRELTVLYGTESGNCESLAERAVAKATESGFAPRAVNMADVTPEALSGMENLLVIVSTWGEGDPPSAAETFHKSFMSKRVDLSRTRFSVCGLGDTSYANFCQTGKEFDSRLDQLGARRVHSRVDCDVDFEEPFARWITTALASLKAFDAVGELDPASIATSPGPVNAPAVEYGKKNPFPSALKDRVLLNGRGSAKETFHYEFDLVGSSFTYEPGDALAVVPSNHPEMVDQIIRVGKFDPATLVPAAGGEEKPLRDALLTDYDITSASAAFLRKLNEFVGNDELGRLLAPEQKDELKSFLWGRQIIDIIELFCNRKFSPKDFVGILRKLPPRLYSIASSLKAHPDEVHLTVATVRYSTYGRNRLGVASAFLAERVDLGQTVPVYLHHNKNFRLPEDPATPVIMVGPGTGIAPFRAFVEDRAAVGATGKNWLFFGDQHFLYDFLYQLEWQSWLKKGLLERLDLAFSRDQQQKIYVQHRMLENGRQIWEWLDNGAHFYVCGDASRMANDVHQALLEIARSEGGLSEDGAADWIAGLKKAKRYQRDVY